MKNNITLNSDQENAVKAIELFLDNPNESEFLLIGPPGTGKTTTIKYALKNEPSSTVYAGAISHAAKKVLEDALKPDIENVFTVAQLLGYKKQAGGVNISFGAQKGIEGKISQSSIVIIDECSMIDDFMYREITKYTGKMKRKIIWMGDKYQLPPVKNSDRESKVFSIKNKFELSVSMRFAGPILQIAEFYRSYIEYASNNIGKEISLNNLITFNPTSNVGPYKVFFTKNSTEFTQMAIKKFAYEPHDTKILAFRNSLITESNSYMRNLFYDESILITPGEKIILNSPCTAQRSKTKFNNGQVITVKNCWESFVDIIISIGETKHYNNRKFKVWVIEVEGKRNSSFLHMLHPESYHVYEDTLDEFKRAAEKLSSLWGEYYKFRDTFIDWSYTYATSSHKAQGQSINNVFVRADDIISVTKASTLTKLKSLYVSVTRAKSNLYVLNPK